MFDEGAAAASLRVLSATAATAAAAVAAVAVDRLACRAFRVAVDDEEDDAAVVVAAAAAVLCFFSFDFERSLSYRGVAFERRSFELVTGGGGGGVGSGCATIIGSSSPSLSAASVAAICTQRSAISSATFCAAIVEATSLGTSKCKMSSRSRS